MLSVSVKEVNRDLMQKNVHSLTCYSYSSQSEIQSSAWGFSRRLPNLERFLVLHYHPFKKYTYIHYEVTGHEVTGHEVTEHFKFTFQKNPEWFGTVSVLKEHNLYLQIAALWILAMNNHRYYSWLIKGILCIAEEILRR